MQAVILAAGQGQRIREHHALPKGFIEIDHKPLMRYSLEALAGYGIDDVLVITGYSAELYGALAVETGAFKTKYNPHYATYGNLYSLYLSRDWVTEDCIIVESDIIYEPRAIDVLMNHPEKDSILVSDITGSKDEVYVEVDDSNHLVNMRKNKLELNQSQIIGEFIGLSKFSFSTFTEFMNLLDNNETLLQQSHYDEGGYIELIKNQPLYCLKESKLLWSEIDNIDQYKFAEKLYPNMSMTIGA